MEKRKEIGEIMIEIPCIIELTVHSAGSEPSTFERGTYDADNERDCTRPDTGDPNDDHGLSPGLDDSPTPSPPLSTNDEERMPMRVRCTTETTYVRALRPSDKANTPRFEKGDLLRVVGEVREFKEGDVLRYIGEVKESQTGSLSYALVRVKPPGERGRALKGFFEKVGKEAVTKVEWSAMTRDERWVFSEEE